MVQPGKYPFRCAPAPSAPCPDSGAKVGEPGQRLLSLRMVEMPSPPDSTVLSLTRRENECLGWCAEGKSYWETAVILGIAERTVSFHMEAMRGKLHAGSNAHAVAIAVQAGLLELGGNRISAPRRGLR